MAIGPGAAQAGEVEGVDAVLGDHPGVWLHRVVMETPTEVVRLATMLVLTFDVNHCGTLMLMPVDTLTLHVCDTDEVTV